MYEKKMRNALVGAVLAVALGITASSLAGQESRKTLSNPAPIYPEIARRMHLEGVVKIQVVIGLDGHIKESKVIGGHPVLVSSVEETLKNWKYVPASSESTTVLEFRFHP